MQRILINSPNIARDPNFIISAELALSYEIGSRPWLGYVSWRWAQAILGWWIGRLTARKHARYKASRKFEARIAHLIDRRN